jgi:ribosomal protein S12 methylthiotransferase
MSKRGTGAVSGKIVRLVTLGCAKNEVDSEEIGGTLAAAGYRVDSLAPNPDVIILNTCGFLGAARKESVLAIRKAVKLKRAGGCERVIVAGCLAQRMGRAMETEAPGADAYVGVGHMARFAEIVNVALSNTGDVYHDERPPQHMWADVTSRARSGASWSAYLKLSEGCDHRCTFCTIPSFRGRHASKPVERLLSEARFLACTGARELNLVAQDVTQYGFDIYREFALPALLRALNTIDGIHWIRLLYFYPNKLTDEVIQAMVDCEKVLPYVDMPLQHVHPELLRAMRRPWDGERYLALLARVRQAIPKCAIRSTFIVGFPGESESHFRYLIEWLKRAELDRVGAFTFSREPGTPAYDMPAQLSAAEKRRRYDALMTTQQAIALDVNCSFVGRRLEVLAERVVLDAGGRAWTVGRSYRDAPEIDGEVYIDSTVPIGEFYDVKITSAHEYDLTASAPRAVSMPDKKKRLRLRVV